MKKPLLKICIPLFILFIQGVGITLSYFSNHVEIEASTIYSGTWETPHTVIINEVMWMGSSISEKDEWIELRNVTDEEIDISGWRIEGAVAGLKGHLQIPNGYTIPANGYFLIANKFEDNDNTDIKLEVDLRSTSINLNDDYVSNGILVLRDKKGNEIDKTAIELQWPAGINGETKHSMQRYSNPDDGWYSCEDPMCGTDKYWKHVGINFGTPGLPNL